MKENPYSEKFKKTNSALQHVRTDFCSMIVEERLRDDTQITSIKNAQFSRHPTSPVYLRPKFFDHLGLGRPMLNN